MKAIFWKSERERRREDEVQFDLTADCNDDEDEE